MNVFLEAAKKSPASGNLRDEKNVCRRLSPHPLKGGVNISLARARTGTHIGKVVPKASCLNRNSPCRVSRNTLAYSGIAVPGVLGYLDIKLESLYPILWPSRRFACASGSSGGASPLSNRQKVPFVLFSALSGANPQGVSQGKMRHETLLRFKWQDSRIG